DGATAYMPYTVVNPDTQRDGPAYIDRWDTHSGKLLGTAALGSNGMFDAVVTRSGNLLALTDTHIVTLDGKTLRPLGSEPVHLPESSSTAIGALAPDGETIAIGSLDGSVLFVDAKTGRTTTAEKSSVAVQRVAFSPTGNVAMTSNESG